MSNIKYLEIDLDNEFIKNAFNGTKWEKNYATVLLQKPGAQLNGRKILVPYTDEEIEKIRQLSLDDK